MIDPGYTHSCVSPKVVERCSLGKVKHIESWLFQLAIGTKIKVSEVVMECLMEFIGVLTKANLNFLPLGSYDAFIGMDWLEKYRDKVECYEKVLECIN